MQPTKTNIKQLKAIFEKIAAGSEDAIGNYLIKGFRIQISKFNSTGTERYMRLYKRRRAEGLCIRCGVKITRKHNGRLYRLCDHHREITDRRRGGSDGK